MFSLANEIEDLRKNSVLDDAAAARLIAIDRREVVSVYGELRFLTWGGVMLLVTGVGVLISKNLDRIGPLAIAIAIAAAAIACYAYCEWRRRASKREGFTHSLVDDYVLLLGALLASADVGFIEHQWHLLGANWQRHFIVLGVLHAVTAYIFNSRLVLSLSISSLAAYLGIERRLERLFDETTDMAMRAFLCSGLVFAWRAADILIRRRLKTRVIPSANDRTGGKGDALDSPFAPVFAHFATNLAFWGALILTFDGSTRVIGCLVAVAFAIASALYGLREREEMFVIYAWVYGVIAVDVFIIDGIVRLLRDDGSLIALYLVVSTVAAVTGLFLIHARLRKAAA